METLNNNPEDKPTLSTEDWLKVENAAMAGANGVQIASLLGKTIKHLYDACKNDKGVEFCEYLNEKWELGNVVLSSKQYELALKGDVNMLILLGKQRLGQGEKSVPKRKVFNQTLGKSDNDNIIDVVH